MDPATGAHLFEIARAFAEQRHDSWRRPPAESASNELRSVGAGVAVRVGERRGLKMTTKLKPIAAHTMRASIEQEPCRAEATCEHAKHDESRPRASARREGSGERARPKTRLRLDVVRERGRRRRALGRVDAK